MLAVNGVGKPSAGEPHARIDGRELETEQPTATATEKNNPGGKPSRYHGSAAYSRSAPPRQLPTLR
jgi:hypothetical protein